MAYNNVSSTYKETKVKTASQGQLIIMLYDEAVRRLNLAIEYLDSNNKNKKDPGKIELISKAVMKAEEIITELMVSLDFDQGGEIAKNLFSLYTWFNRELLEANIQHDVTRITAVRSQLNELKSAWMEIVARTSHETTGKVVTGVNIAG